MAKKVRTIFTILDEINLADEKPDAHFSPFIFSVDHFFAKQNSDPLETDFAKHISKGDSLVNLKQFDAAIKYYDRAIGNATDKTTAYHKRAMAFLPKKTIPKPLTTFRWLLNRMLASGKMLIFSGE